MELFCGVCRAWTPHTAPQKGRCAACGEPHEATMKRSVPQQPERTDENGLDRLVQPEHVQEKGFLLRKGFMDEFGEVWQAPFTRQLPPFR